MHICGKYDLQLPEEQYHLLAVIFHQILNPNPSAQWAEDETIPTGSWPLIPALLDLSPVIFIPLYY